MLLLGITILFTLCSALHVLPGAQYNISITVPYQTTRQVYLYHAADVHSWRNRSIHFLNNYVQLNQAGKREYYANDAGLSIIEKSRTSTTITFGGVFTAPMLEGLVQPLYELRHLGETTNLLSYQIKYDEIDISCSDGVYCNGLERLIRGVCVRPTVPPCDSLDRNNCTSYQCIESEKRCGKEPRGTNCTVCNTGIKSCKPSCNGKVCGDDGCSGSCGTCSGTLSCVSGSCQDVVALGSCPNPAPLLQTNGSVVPAAGVHDLYLYEDSSKGVDITTPVCNIPGIPEYVYKFTVLEPMGFEMRLTCADGGNGCDTLLAIHDANCRPFDLTAVDRLCSDDQTPPGNVASRVDGKLPPGTYTVIVTGYSSATVGPFQLSVKFTPDCYPKCESMFCGSDDCGGSCGACGNGLSCYFGRCRSNPCLPNCKGRVCGDDGCGGSCGVCKGDKSCDYQLGTCIPISPCDNFIPDCKSARNGKGPDVFCGSDCEWHRLDEEAPDLVASLYDEVLPSMNFFWRNFDTTSCAISEGCVRGTGSRLLFTFDTFVHNVGHGDLVGPEIGKNPQLFEWANCHQHYHFQKFARFYLNNITTHQPVISGAKLAYCMEDSKRYFSGPTVPCDPQFDCLSQGIPRGRTDLYPGSLDCQWVDITDGIKPGCWYEKEVCTNIGRSIYENSYENNCVRYPVYVPTIPVGYQGVLQYRDAIVADNAQSFYPGCKA